ncbi:hypothetical protein HMPREF1015_02039 [Bacillus smithii 7_3_47FAA]|uniref:Uncharacterized protein n=1 Tax=Bacillus smithii 7_3_47FAA TaxID=665952 RepID=G9QLY1_9BACI|nr:Hypothetical protein BSM4216_0446 [Bacillus smithii]EHL77688.1 hypothetical protein HMPREF1015_02039 [Bacillus smithii 7_3_47FAA]
MSRLFLLFKGSIGRKKIFSSKGEKYRLFTHRLSICLSHSVLCLVKVHNAEKILVNQSKTNYDRHVLTNILS